MTAQVRDAKTIATNQTRAKDGEPLRCLRRRTQPSWPDDGDRRESKVARFAMEHGFRLRFYRDGLCAIFDKQPVERSEE